jgi:hypothetical protein
VAALGKGILENRRLIAVAVAVADVAFLWVGWVPVRVCIVRTRSVLRASYHTAMPPWRPVSRPDQAVVDPPPLCSCRRCAQRTLFCIAPLSPGRRSPLSWGKAGGTATTEAALPQVGMDPFLSRGQHLVSCSGAAYCMNARVGCAARTCCSV